MYEVGGIYDVDQCIGDYRCTDEVYSYTDGMRLFEMQNITDEDYVIVDEYGELYGEGSFDDWGF